MTGYEYGVQHPYGIQVCGDVQRAEERLAVMRLDGVYGPAKNLRIVRRPVGDWEDAS